MRKILILVLFCVFLNAHSMHIFVESKDDEFINLSSYFRGNSPCKKCDVSIVFDGKSVDFGTTDENGKVKIKMPDGDFEVKISGGLGHEARLKVENSSNSKKIEISQIPNDEVKSSKPQNLQISKNKSSDTNLEILDNEAFKFSLSFLILFGFFGLIYALKFKRKK